jgi:hypothetical protein
MRSRDCAMPYKRGIKALPSTRSELQCYLLETAQHRQNTTLFSTAIETELLYVAVENTEWCRVSE